MPRKSSVVGTLWIHVREDEDGNKSRYFTGYLNLGVLGQVEIAVFKNSFKKEGTHPDYNIVLSEPKKQKQEVEADDDSDIPF
jgi:hypothetical protein